MAITVLFKICEKGEAYPHFEQLKPYLQDKEYLAVKLTKKPDFTKIFFERWKSSF